MMSIRDALLSSNKGQNIVVQSRQQIDEQEKRFIVIRDLARIAFRWHKEAYIAVKGKCTDLAFDGGPKYERALTVLRFARTGKDNYEASIRELSYPEDLDSQIDTPHNFREYETSDHYARG